MTWRNICTNGATSEPIAFPTTSMMQMGVTPGAIIPGKSMVPCHLTMSHALSNDHARPQVALCTPSSTISAASWVSLKFRVANGDYSSCKAFHMTVATTRSACQSQFVWVHHRGLGDFTAPSSGRETRTSTFGVVSLSEMPRRGNCISVFEPRYIAFGPIADAGLLTRRCVIHDLEAKPESACIL